MPENAEFAAVVGGVYKDRYRECRILAFGRDDRGDRIIWDIPANGMNGCPGNIDKDEFMAGMKSFVRVDEISPDPAYIARGLAGTWGITEVIEEAPTETMALR